MRDADCAIIVFDLANRKSYENLCVWNNMFDQYRQGSSIKAVVGNKSDLSDNRFVFNYNLGRWRKVRRRSMRLVLRRGILRFRRRRGRSWRRC